MSSPFFWHCFFENLGFILSVFSNIIDSISEFWRKKLNGKHRYQIKKQNQGFFPNMINTQKEGAFWEKFVIYKIFFVDSLTYSRNCALFDLDI